MLTPEPEERRIFGDADIPRPEPGDVLRLPVVDFTDHPRLSRELPGNPSRRQETSVVMQQGFLS
jgi:hypothetical protein